MAKDSSEKNPAGSWQTRIWQKPKKWFWFGIPAGGYLLFMLGIGLWNTFNAAIDVSSTEEFCISCHVMKDTVYPEYQQTIHYSNRAGVRATCDDCHVPGPYFAKMERKVGATLHEVPHWVLGTINTPEKFEARRLYLAKRVWTSMKENDSRECRNCHELDHMDLEAQQRSARSKHTLKRQIERGETCIDCHQGIAHKLPDGWEDEF